MQNCTSATPSPSLQLRWQMRACNVLCTHLQRKYPRWRGGGVCIWCVSWYFPFPGQRRHTSFLFSWVRGKKVATVQQCALSRHQGSLFLIRCWLTFPDPSHTWHGPTAPDPLLAYFSWSAADSLFLIRCWLTFPDPLLAHFSWSAAGSLFLIRCWLTFSDPSHTWPNTRLPDSQIWPAAQARNSRTKTHFPDLLQNLIRGDRFS